MKYSNKAEYYEAKYIGQLDRNIELTGQVERLTEQVAYQSVSIRDLTYRYDSLGYTKNLLKSKIIELEREILCES
jgi:hypothetical protein